MNDFQQVNYRNLENKKMKKTKIVATLGPASMNKEVLREMIQSGLNVCRLNFSHGAYDDHATAVQTIRELNEELGSNVAILADLQGPKIRTNEMENNGVLLEVGKEIKIIVEKVVGNAERFSINYTLLPKDVSPGERILLDDGKIVLEVIESDGHSTINCRIVQGGILSSKKGVNFPNTNISMPSLTEKDRLDLEFALQQNVDWI
jgi:pyruvate kinase